MSGTGGPADSLLAMDARQACPLAGSSSGIIVGESGCFEHAGRHPHRMIFCHGLHPLMASCVVQVAEGGSYISGVCMHLQQLKSLRVPVQHGKLIQILQRGCEPACADLVANKCDEL